MAEPIRGKVACVLNAREIAINVGSKHGVSVNMFFDVVGSEHSNIKDPDTKEVLGSIMRPKVRVKIIEVEEKLSVATTYRREDVSIRGPFADLLMSYHPTAEYKYETLKIADEPAEKIDEIESYVNIGDLVVQSIR